jgi:hypothetical protein
MWHGVAPVWCENITITFQCRYPEQSLPSKINQQNFSFVQGDMQFSVELIGNLYLPESYVWSLTIGLSLVTVIGGRPQCAECKIQKRIFCLVQKNTYKIDKY